MSYPAHAEGLVNMIIYLVGGGRVSFITARKNLGIDTFWKCLPLTVNKLIQIIIIIMSCRQHGFPWPSPATLLYRPSLPVGLQATSCIGTELLYLGSSWSSCLCSTMWKGLREYVTYKFVPTSPAECRMSGLSNLDSFKTQNIVVEHFDFIKFSISIF